MNVHEYQGKEILRRFGVATPRGVPCFSVAEADAAARQLGGKVWVVKAQIHAGGRGKGGGVKVAKSLQEVHDFASKILGMTLVTHQTGPEGRLVRRLLVEEGRKSGHTFSQPDLIIAATALEHGLTLVSRDTSDYERARVPVVNPWRNDEGSFH